MPGLVEFNSKALMNCDYEKKKKWTDWNLQWNHSIFSIRSLTTRDKNRPLGNWVQSQWLNWNQQSRNHDSSFLNKQVPDFHKPIDPLQLYSAHLKMNAMLPLDPHFYAASFPNGIRMECGPVWDLKPFQTSLYLQRILRCPYRKRERKTIAISEKIIIT